LYQTERRSLWRTIDWTVVLLYLTLCIIGCLSIYGASYDFEQPGFFDFAQRSGKQFVWIILALVIGISILLVESNNYFSWAFFIYFVLMGLMFVTIFIASDIKGSRSWLVFGPVHLQPAEFAKVATALAISRVMGSYNFNLKRNNHAAIVAMILLFPFLLTLLQNETGSALVFLSMMLMLYREGMPGIILFLVVCFASFFIIGLRFGEDMLFTYTSIGQFAVLLLILLVVCVMLVSYRNDVKSMKVVLIGNLSLILIGVLLNAMQWWIFNLCWLQLGLFGVTALYLFGQSVIRRTSVHAWIACFVIVATAFLYATNYVFNNVLEPHHQLRIEVLLGMEDDLGGAGYNVNQSKIAIGSGGFFGKGYLNGTQTKLKYVPEQDTDFIFCTVGEEQGFFGSIFVLGLYLALLLRLIYLAERQQSAFSRIYGYCVVSILFFHVMINVGMVLGLVPVIGIPLPFFSYGGSSLWAFTILLFIFLRLDADRAD